MCLGHNLCPMGVDGGCWFNGDVLMVAVAGVGFLVDVDSVMYVDSP